MTIQEWLMSIAQQYQLLGIFIVSFIGASSIFFPIPYTVIIFYLGLEGWNPALLAFAGGLGAAIGELTGYLLGYCGRKIISTEKKQRMQYLTKILNKFGLAAVFLFALTPLPDDLIFIPLGTLKYPIHKVFAACFAGKLLICFALAYFGKLYGGIIEIFFGEAGGWVTEILSIVVLVFIYYVLMKVDWQSIFEKHSKRGD